MNEQITNPSFIPVFGSKINPPKNAPNAAPIVLNIAASPTASEEEDISCLIAFVAAVNETPNKIVGMSRKINEIKNFNPIIFSQLGRLSNINPLSRISGIRVKKYKDSNL